MKFSSYFSYRDFLLSRRRGESGWSGRNRKRYKGVGVLDGTMESKISGIVSPVRSGAENKKKGRRSFLSSLCSIRGALGPCRPLTVRQPRLESLVWTGFLEFFSDGPPFRRSPPLPNFSRRDLSLPSNQSFYEFYSRERVKSHPFFFTSKDGKFVFLSRRSVFFERNKETRF